MTQTETPTFILDSMSHDANYALADSCLPGAALGGHSLPEDVRFVIQRSEGVRLWDVDGNCYIDYVCGGGNQILGHAHPAIAAAISEQATKGHQWYATLNEACVQLAAELRDSIPCAEKIAYTTTGSEATFLALRLARAFTGRDKILKFEGAYHGNHDCSHFSTFPKTKANYPDGHPDSSGIPSGVQETVLVAPFNNLETTRRIVEENRGDLAAIIAEPMQRVIQPEPDFLPGLRKLCDDNDVMLILDEVVTGFRLAYGGAQEYFDIRPDLATYGKLISAGGPLACVAGLAEIIELCNPQNKGEPNNVYINGTLYGSPLASVAGLANLHEIKKPGFYESLNAYGDDYRNAVQQTIDRHGLGGIVCGSTSMWQILFCDSAPRNAMDVLESDMAKTRRLDTELLRRGVYVRPGTRHFLASGYTDADFEDTMEAMDAACRVLASA